MKKKLTDGSRLAGPGRSGPGEPRRGPQDYEPARAAVDVLAEDLIEFTIAVLGLVPAALCFFGFHGAVTVSAGHWWCTSCLRGGSL